MSRTFFLQFRIDREVLDRAADIVTRHHMPAGFRDPLELGQRRLRLAQPLQQVLAPHQIEPCIRKRQRKHVGALECEIVDSFGAGAGTGVVEILVADVDPNHLHVRE